jgi:hypothetical protein
MQRASVGGCGGGGLGGEQRREGQEVAGARCAVRDEGEDFGDEALLDACFLGVLC